MTDAAIAAEGLEKRFGRAVALRDVELEIPAGASLAVLGPNGAGKTTLLRLMAGLVRPTAGSLRVAGHRAGSRRARARVGWIGHATCPSVSPFAKHRRAPQRIQENAEFKTTN